MSLSQRLLALRNERGLSQQEMADIIGIHPNSWKKYEAAHTQPSIEVLIKIARTLHVSTDYLLFGGHESVLAGELLLLFEAVSQLSASEQQIVREVLESLIIKYQTRRWDLSRMAGKTEK